MIHATIGRDIRIRYGDVPKDVLEEIQAALSIKNQAKDQARREYLDGWEEMPDTIDMWYRDGPDLVLPRGFYRQFVQGMDAARLPIWWVDRRSVLPMDSEYVIELSKINLREHQEPAVKAMIEYENGIYQAPPGSGKTVTVLEAIRRSRQRAIILVDKSNIMRQWVDRAQEFLGVPIGTIGDGNFDPGEITVALKQTLWSRREELKESGFFDEWGFVAYDECHHVTAETYQFVIQQFSARYLIGASATPARIPWTFPIAEALLGRIFHETPRDILIDKGILAIPEVNVVPTDFEFKFRSSSVNRGGYRVGNNYAAMMKDLTTNPKRNQQIASWIASMEGRRQLVVSKRLEQFDLIANAVKNYGYADPIYWITGKESSDERKAVAEFAQENPCLVFSTVADEALDIPMLDTIHLVWPTKNVSVVRQQVGRVERASEGKKQPLVFDYYDHKIGVLRNQFAQRMRGVYRPEQFPINWPKETNG